jgi:nucleotide-binding universal stress UspA family protein
MVIIAPIDQSSRAHGVVEEGAKLAEAFDDPLHVVHVLTRSKFVDLGRTAIEKEGKTVNIDEVRTTAREIAEDTIESVGVDATPVGLMGSPKDQILEYATENDARYIVLGPRRRSPTGKAVFGSVSQSILLGSNCPVVTLIQDTDR